MRDRNKATTPQAVQPGHQKPTSYRPPAQWTPRYDEFLLSVPVAWQCPCGGLVHTTAGRICCPECGRIPRDTVPGKLESSQRCTTGRQGRSWKRIGKGGRC